MSDPSQAWENMLDIITNEADKTSPLRKFCIKNTKSCWLTNELIEQMKDRDYFYRKAKTLSDEDYWNIAKFHRNQVNFNICKAKADFIKDQLKNNYGNSARFWRSIKQVMPSQKGTNKNSKIVLIDDKDELIDSKCVAEYMNDFFANLGAQNRPRPRMINSFLNTSIPLGSLCQKKTPLNSFSILLGKWKWIL